MTALNPALTDRLHRAIGNETNVGGYSPMRHCRGECKRRRSITQFVGSSDVCIRCARRAPKPQEAT